MRVAVIGGFAPSLVNFRGEMLREMVAAGHSVRAMAPEQDDSVVRQLQEIGVSYARIPLARAGINPLADVATLAALAIELRRFRAEATLMYTAKPVIYGTLAARLAGVGTRCAMVTGIGSAFEYRHGASRFIALVLRALYSLALRQADVVFFQNPDDEALFRKLGLLRTNPRVVRINGSGVDLTHFAAAPLPPKPPIIFLMIARLLRDKGVIEYAEAARAIRSEYPDTRFRLLGGLDPNPSAVSERELAGWRTDGVIEYLGTTTDVRPALAACHVFVLPSYAEGTPRSVLEAMAMARPILTTDASGCRETVEHGVNGLLVRPRDAISLAEGMRKMIEFAAQPGALEAMGGRSRALAERKFEVHTVNRVILDAMGLYPGGAET